jgi:hypothetical protein
LTRTPRTLKTASGDPWFVVSLVTIHFHRSSRFW